MSTLCKQACNHPAVILQSSCSPLCTGRRHELKPRARLPPSPLPRRTARCTERSASLHHTPRTSAKKGIDIRSESTKRTRCDVACGITHSSVWGGQRGGEIA